MVLAKDDLPIVAFCVGPKSALLVVLKICTHDCSITKPNPRKSDPRRHIDVTYQIGLDNAMISSNVQGMATGKMMSNDQ